MNSMMLLVALSAGQGPAGGDPAAAPAYSYPVLPPLARGAAPETLPDLVHLPGAGAGMLQTPQPLPPQGPPPAAPANGNGCDPCNACDVPEPPPEPWALMRCLKGTCFGDRLESRRISISGWTQGNYTASTANRSNFPVTFNDRADFWQMNQNFLRIDRSIDTEKDEFQIGGRTEWILPGTDARFTPSRGLFDDQTGDYRIDMIQAYVETFHPNLGPKGTSVKWGKFATHCSYELMQGAETPFLSRSYLFLYNPFTHTGAFATTPLNDTWTMSHGMVLGSDNFFGAPSRPTYIGSLRWAPKEGRGTAQFNTVITDPTFHAGEAFPFYNYYGMILTRKFGEKLTGVVDMAASHMDGIPGVSGAAWWYGVAGYAFYQVNDKWNVAFRQELFEDDKGVRTGFAGLYSGTTLGVGFTPVRALMIRPSVRYDHNFDTGAFEGKRNLFTACMDVIIRW
jgi:hypothetical protein